MHVAIIMDGNGRWAQARNWPRWKGHVAGVESVRAVVRAAPELGIDTLTLYAFSSDNWKRPSAEVRRLFHLLRRYCRSERRDLVKRGVRVSALGRRDRIPPRVVDEIERLECATRQGTTLHLRLALDYSSRAAITAAARALAAQPRPEGFDPSHIRWEDLHALISQGVPDPDLLIRTAGEKRLSDFLLWEISYAELHFTDVPWPAFRGEHLAMAVDDFRGRERRFGTAGDGASKRQRVRPRRLAG